jgi:hypothetical protein
MLPPTASRGMFEAVLTGWQLAAGRLRPLLAVQLPIVAVLLAGNLLLDLSPNTGDRVLIDGLQQVTNEPAAVSIARTVLTAACSLLAVLAGAIALARPADRPIRAAARRLPVVALGLVPAVAVSFLLLWIMPNWFGVALFLISLSLLAGRLLLQALVPHPTWRAAASVVLGFLGITLPLGYVVGVFSFWPPLTAPARTLLLVTVLAGLAGILALHAGAPETSGAPPAAGTSVPPAEGADPATPGAPETAESPAPAGAPATAGDAGCSHGGAGAAPVAGCLRGPRASAARARGRGGQPVRRAGRSYR